MTSNDVQIGMWTFSSFGLFQSKGLKAMQVIMHPYAAACRANTFYITSFLMYTMVQNAMVLSPCRRLEPAQDEVYFKVYVTRGGGCIGIEVPEQDCCGCRCCLWQQPSSATLCSGT